MTENLGVKFFEFLCRVERPWSGSVRSREIRRRSRESRSTHNYLPGANLLSASDPTGASSGLRSPDRALRLIEHLSRSPQGLTAKQLARRTGIPVKTVYHHLKTIIDRGWAWRGEDGRHYFIPDALGSVADVTVRLDRVQPVLQRLAADTGCGVLLTSLRDERLTVIAHGETTGALRLDGMADDLAEAVHATAAGRALLAAMPSQHRHRYLKASGLRPFTGRTVRSQDELDDELRIAAETGVYTEYGQWRSDVACSAVIVRTGPRTSDNLALAIAMRIDMSGGRRRAADRFLRLALADLVPMLAPALTPDELSRSGD
ncbi:IclR family transcriptional regulator [Promicromonospora iranensis]|uniref:DNA-binding IclR family transcriptional regulator n=1 Tax=Promicromonospora iranensis TaxID=1105144 RepID=A0ABU2CIQ4_9MICO|nr:IclR family transcriptional regulator C-terminal domain-containing protein [Promicromonospora iranensis]MDR7381219.1 DNA-binding IclR family transcriptional regulator [Promicromonospora iranensis]